MVVIIRCSTPKESESTFATGARQLVVQEALLTTKWLSGSYVSSLTPKTKVASASSEGAEMTTREAPASRWPAESERERMAPVDSTTTSTPRSPAGSFGGTTPRGKGDLEPVPPEPITRSRHLARVPAVNRVVLEQVSQLV